MNPPRKRKKYKFARFGELPNCFEAEQFDAKTRDKFIGSAPLTVELGAGTGKFCVELARRYPNRRFIAIDVKADRLYVGASLAAEEGLANICFVRAHASKLTEIFNPHSLNELWLTFPDPFPKKRAAKHRMTHPVFLNIYRELLASDGSFYFKTDNQGLFEWSLEELVETGVKLQFLTFDLHESNAPDDFKIMTTYEQRYTGEGKPIYALSASFFS